MRPTENINCVPKVRGGMFNVYGPPYRKNGLLFAPAKRLCIVPDIVCTFAGIFYCTGSGGGTPWDWTLDNVIVNINAAHQLAVDPDNRCIYRAEAVCLVHYKFVNGNETDVTYDLVATVDPFGDWWHVKVSGFVPGPAWTFVMFDSQLNGWCRYAEIANTDKPLVNPLPDLYVSSGGDCTIEDGQ